MNKARKFQSSNDAHQHNHFNGAAVIDRFGNEIPITESMVQQALQTLIDAWETTRQQRPAP